MNIFLHRDDLRIHDNVGLRKASVQEKVLPVFVDDPEIREFEGDRKTKFKIKAVRSLAEEYEKRNSGFLYRRGKTAEVIEQIIEEKEAESLYFNRGYTPVKRRVQNEIEKLDVETRSFKDRLLVEPKDLNKEYSTFSHFYNEWKEIGKKKPVSEPQNFVSGKVQKPQDPELDTDFIPSEETALEKWRDFRDNRLKQYKDRRDDLSNPESVSRLSMYYSSGLLGIRKVLEDVENLIQEEDDSSKIRNYAKYRSELAWREFFYQVLWHNPEAVNENYREFENEIEWKNSQKEFEAWKKGETGVPLVDAGMRELEKTGYMHNRTRQNVASFLTKHLMIDWRKGARFFREKLVDHDTASNNGGWQWAASTGTDSVSIRIFNPVKQGRKYDPEAEYIKRHVPELRDLEAEKIHNWVEMGEDQREKMETEYPGPIINFNKRYHQGKKMFERALGK